MSRYVADIETYADMAGFLRSFVPEIAVRFRDGDGNLRSITAMYAWDDLKDRAYIELRAARTILEKKHEAAT